MKSWIKVLLGLFLGTMVGLIAKEEISFLKYFFATMEAILFGLLSSFFTAWKRVTTYQPE